MRSANKAANETEKLVLNGLRLSLWVRHSLVLK